MKFITFFLAFLVLAQTTLPCADEQRVEEELASCSASCPGEQTEHTDTCSPFCVCICCATHPLSHAMNNAMAPTPVSADYFALRDNARVIDRAVPVWQPPQLN
jgi:hypothetical protein